MQDYLDLSCSCYLFSCVADANYLGCLPAVNSISTEVILASHSSPFDCTFTCSQHNKPYALLYRGGDCYCTRSAEISVAVSNELCQTPCKKRKTLTCGGKTHVAAFAVLEFNNKTLQIFAPLWTTESATFNLSIESSESTEFHVYTDKDSTSTKGSYVSLSFHDHGFKSLVVEATMGRYKQETMQVKRSVFVAGKAKSLSLTCPRLTVASQMYECILEGYTEELDIFKYTIDGVLLDSIALPGKRLLGKFVKSIITFVLYFIP